MLQGMNVQDSSVMNYTIPDLQAGASHSKLTNILPKTNNSGVGHVFTNEDIVTFLRSLEVTNTTNIAPTTSIVIPSNFTVNNLQGAGRSLMGQNVSTLPFSPYIVNNNILTNSNNILTNSNNILTNSNNMLTNSQQDTMFLGSSAQMINTLPSTNTLQAPGIVPGFQTLNTAQPLTNFPSLNMTPQNTALGLHQKLAPVYNPGTQSAAIFTGNMNQTVSSVVTSSVPPSQQTSFKVPVLIGNQIILMDVPTQYPAGVSLANTSTTVSLPSFGQSLGLFSSAITPTIDTQPATACIISTALPCNSLSTNSIKPDVAATSLNLAPHLQPHPGRANIGAQGPRKSPRSLKSPPPLILASSLFSQYQSQDEIKWLTANSDALCSENIASSEISAKSKLPAVQNMKNQRMEAQTNLSPTEANLVLPLQYTDKDNSANNNKEIHLDSIVQDSQKHTPNSKFSKSPLPNRTSGAKSKKRRMASDMLNKIRSANNLMTKNVRSFQMETPDTIKRKMFSSVDNPQTNIISDNAGTEKQCKTVKDMQERKVSYSVEKKAKANISQRTGQQPRILKPKPKGKLLLTRLPLLMSSKKIKESIDKKLQPSSKPTDISTELLPNQTVTNCQNNSAVDDDDDKSWVNDDAICKISEVKSIADFLPQTHPLLLKNKQYHGLNPAQGTVFVGPLTKEQLDSIILNPKELGKYVNVPSGHVMSSKAIAIPSVSSALTVPVTVQSGDTAKKIAPAPAVCSYILPSYPQSQFVKIHPKPKIYPKSACLPSCSATTTTATTTTTIRTVNSSQAAVPETSFSSLSVVPKTRINILATASDENNGGRKRMVRGEKSKSKSSLCLSEVCKDEKAASPHQHEYQLECNTAKDSENSNILQLSFNGDLNLLKDALRKTTVELKNLDSKTLNTLSWPRRDENNSSDREMSDSSEDDYEPKCRKRHWRENEQTNIGLTRNKENELVENVHKRCVPLEAVGDLVIQGRLLEDEIGHSEESNGRAIRRSNRISAKPRLDYADLERLPFHDSDDSDCELDIASLSPYSQSSQSPPLLSPISDQIHNQDLFVDITPEESVDMEAQNTVSTTHSLEQTQVTTHPVLQPQSTTHPVVQLQATTPPVLQPQGTTHPVLQLKGTTHPVLQPQDTTHPVLQPQATSPPVLQPQDVIHPLLQPQATSHSVSQPQDVIHPLLQPQATSHSVSQPQATSHLVSQLKATPHLVSQLKATPHSVSQLKATPHLVSQLRATPHLVSQLKATPHLVSQLKATPHSVSQLKAISHSVPQPQATSHSVPQPQVTSHSVPQPQVTSHSVPQPQVTSHSVPQPQVTSHSVPQPQATSHSVPQPQVTSHSVPQPQVTSHSVPQPQATSHSVPQPQATSHSMSQPKAPSLSVSQVQAVIDIDGVDSLSKANDSEDCYYSSESESDMFDSCDKSLSEAGSKKMMWKRHSEITLFLVKHAGRFHSDDEKGEHYCNICLRYKTNGIFRLSHHLKKHLDGTLRCSQCEFEACHEVNLGEHRKTRHAL